ncbi:MAG: hypothetical protein ABIN10_13060 [Specibacter sp.]
MNNDANTGAAEAAVMPERFSMRYGVPAVLIGWFVTFLVFCLGLTVVNVASSGDFVSGWYLLPYALMFGFPVAAIVGLPLALLLAWGLRRVRDQRLHVLVFALAMGAVTTAIMFVLAEAQMVPGNFVIAAGVAAGAAIGRAVVIKMAARRNAQ